jgi:protoporphyrinogen/coproporphyrinogen III oxidase
VTNIEPMPVDVGVVVVGAGISGLTAAFGLQRHGHSVEVLEAAPRPGGVIGSRRRDGALFETGPNSALDTTPLIDALLADLGIRNERRNARAVASTRYVVRNGKLVALPSSPRAFIATSAFTPRAKLRLLAEPFIAPTPAGREESIAAFARRRLGTEFLEYAVDPFVAGIYAGDPELISMPAAFPRLLALEQKHGSLIKGRLEGRGERRRAAGKAPSVAASFSFRSGMQTLTDALAKKLLRIEYGVRVERVTPGADGSWPIEGSREGVPMVRRARAVIVAAPAPAAAAMIQPHAPQAARALQAIDYAPIVATASAYRRADVGHSLAGFGFLVPRKERRTILGSLFSSSMFDGRAPEGTVLVTTFAGGRRDPEIAALGDDAVRAAVSKELASLLAAPSEPLWQEIVRWPQAIPQYNLGHLGRLATLDAAEAALPGLFFCASYRGGVAVGDCIKSASAIVPRLDRFLRGS